MKDEGLELKKMSFLCVDKMISRFLLKSTAVIGRSSQQRLSGFLLLLQQKQQRRNISTLLSISFVRTSFFSLRFLSKNTKSNKKYQVSYHAIQLITINLDFQPMSYGPKSKRPIIEIYHKMTVKALAQAMDISVGQCSDYFVFL